MHEGMNIEKPEYYCKRCDKRAQCYEVFDNHMSSAKHVRARMLLQEMYL